MDEWVKAHMLNPDHLNLIPGIIWVEVLTPALTPNVPCSVCLPT